MKPSRDEIIPVHSEVSLATRFRWNEKKKKDAQTLWACFYLIFDSMCFPTSTCLNITKVTRNIL